MDIKSIKKEFPIFSQKINGKPLVYLDSANSSQKPKSVIDKISNFYETEFSNVGRSVHTLAVKATNRFEATRDKVQKYLNAKHREEIIFTKSATESINLVASSFGKKHIHKGDEILITELEHHSNYVPWHYLRSEKGAIIKFAPVNEDGDVEINSIKKLITDKTKIIAITHISNVTGAILPITKIVDLAKEKNIPVLIDGTQGAPHCDIDMQKIDCDFYAISCHKMYGPNGLGILYMKKKWVDDLPPYQGGGGMINEVKKEDITFAEKIQNLKLEQCKPQKLFLLQSH
jgi:cysteine desulfurase/selenocysteine lyase